MTKSHSVPDENDEIDLPGGEGLEGRRLAKHDPEEEQSVAATDTDTAEEIVTYADPDRSEEYFMDDRDGSDDFDPRKRAKLMAIWQVRKIQTKANSATANTERQLETNKNTPLISPLKSCLEWWKNLSPSLKGVTAVSATGFLMAACVSMNIIHDKSPDVRKMKEGDTDSKATSPSDGTAPPGGLENIEGILAGKEDPKVTFLPEELSGDDRPLFSTNNETRDSTEIREQKRFADDDLGKLESILKKDPIGQKLDRLLAMLAPEESPKGKEISSKDSESQRREQEAIRYIIRNIVTASKERSEDQGSNPSSVSRGFIIHHHSSHTPGSDSDTASAPTEVSLSETTINSIINGIASIIMPEAERKELAIEVTEAVQQTKTYSQLPPQARRDVDNVLSLFPQAINNPSQDQTVIDAVVTSIAQNPESFTVEKVTSAANEALNILSDNSKVLNDLPDFVEQKVKEKMNDRPTVNAFIEKNRDALQKPETLRSRLDKVRPAMREQVDSMAKENVNRLLPKLRGLMP